MQGVTQPELTGRWEHVSKLLRRNGPFVGAGFEPDTAEAPKNLNFLRENSKILIIGAGGLGCELLKDLALVGFKNIDVIDMDTIDATNLNRQFLFRGKDVGKPKSEVAAAFINNRIPGVNVTSYFGSIQSKDDDFYRKYNIIICGLDSIEARRWINSLVIGLVEIDDDGLPDPTTIIPIIDGGTEGFKGQARVIIPRITSCFECSLDAFPPKKTYPLCTLAATPRIPEHCIQWASLVHWDEEKPFGVDKEGRANKIDNDSPEHMKWLFDRATERAEKNNITGVTYKLTQGVVKNIIPAIASSNAIIAAACSNEAYKIATNCSGTLNNYMMYMGNNGLYTYTFDYAKKETCPVCGSIADKVTVNPEMKLQDFIEVLRESPKYQLRKPSFNYEGKPLYMQSPPQLEEFTRPNLQKTLRELVQDEATIDVTDPALSGVSIEIKIVYDK